MTHHHDHPHDHHHDHHHDPHHDDVPSALTFEEKLIKLLQHWLKHNRDHGHTYREWAERAKANGLPQVGLLIDEIGDITRGIDDKIKETLSLIQGH